MSSLKDPVTPIDLSPNIPNSISTSDIAHYCYPLIWSLYSPDALIEYISTYTTAGSAQATVSLKSVSYRLFATVTLVAMLMVTGYGVLDSIFGWIMGEELFDLFNLMAGWIGVFLGALATFIYFSFVKNPALRIASQAVIGLTSSIMTGLFFMDPRLQLPGYFAIFASIGLGSVLGFYFNTLAWYEQDSLLVNLLLVLASIAVGGFVFIQGLFIGAGFQGSGTIWFALIVGVISFVASTLRIDDWLCHRVERLLLPNQSIYEATPRVTWLKSCKLVFALENDLEQRWQQGLQNCIQVLRYTNQHWAVLDAIHTLLDEKSEGERKELMVEVEQLWQTLFRDPQRMQSSFRLPFRNCDLSVFLPRAALKTKKPSSASRFAAFKKVLGVGPKLKQTAPEKRRAYRQQIQQREEQRAPLLQKIPLTTPVASAVAGIRYLEQERSKEAGEAFDKVKFSPLGAEMAQISEMLETLWTSENLPDSGLLKLPKPPANPAHKDTWKSFALFRNIVRYVWILKRCADQCVDQYK